MSALLPEEMLLPAVPYTHILLFSINRGLTGTQCFLNSRFLDPQCLCNLFHLISVPDFLDPHVGTPNNATVGFCWNTSIRASNTGASFQNVFKLGPNQNLCVWLAVVAPQFLCHELVCIGLILATICGVLENLMIIFHLNSLQVLVCDQVCLSKSSPRQLVV